MKVDDGLIWHDKSLLLRSGNKVQIARHGEKIELGLLFVSGTELVPVEEKSCGAGNDQDAIYIIYT